MKAIQIIILAIIVPCGASYAQTWDDYNYAGSAMRTAVVRIDDVPAGGTKTVVTLRGGTLIKSITAVVDSELTGVTSCTLSAQAQDSAIALIVMDGSLADRRTFHFSGSPLFYADCNYTLYVSWIGADGAGKVRFIVEYLDIIYDYIPGAEPVILRTYE